MAKITIEELYYGDKYAVMSEVFKTMFLASPNKAGVDEQTALELEIVRQTLIAVEKMKKNGDCIAEGGTVKYFSQIRLCQNEVVRRESRRGGCQAPLVCPVAYPGGVVKGAASAAFIGVTGNGHGDP